MTKFLRSLALAALLCLAGISAQAQSLLGSYAMEGSDADGTKYKGTVAITQTGAGMTITWEIEGEKLFGAALLAGQTLAVGSVLEGKSIVQVMTVQGDGSLTGVWYRRGETKTGTETWKKR